MTVTELSVRNNRVLFVIPVIGTGGAELQALLQIAALRRRGLEISLLVLSRNSDPAVRARLALPADRLCELANRSDVLDREFLLDLPGTLGRASAFAAAQGCATVVAHLPAAHVFSRLLKIALLARGRRVRLYQYHHSEERRLAPLDTLAKRLFFAADQGLARLCDHAHLHVSEAVRADVAGGMFTRRDAVLHNTCDMDSEGDHAAAEALLEPARQGGNPFLVLLPGRLLARKGHALLLRALRPLIAREGLTAPDIQIVFAGEGPERGGIEAAIRDTGLGEHVTLPGSGPHKTLLALYEMADLVVVPSLIEGFGIVAIEALSRGALLIASDAAGLDEIVRPGRNALQFPAGDERALAALLAEVWVRRGETIIERGGLRAEMAARFGIDAHIDRLLALIGDG